MNNFNLKNHFLLKIIKKNKNIKLLKIHQLKVMIIKKAITKIILLLLKMLQIKSKSSFNKYKLS